MRMRISKVKNWKKRELEELKQLVNSMNNDELCEYFKTTPTNLINTMQKHKIRRDKNKVTERKREVMSGENNPNWQGGISKDGARYSAIQRERHPEHKRARDAVYRAVRKGTLIKPDKCEECGKETTDLQGHHESYEPEHWLDVEWLCRKCHRKREDGLH